MFREFVQVNDTFVMVTEKVYIEITTVPGIRAGTLSWPSSMLQGRSRFIYMVACISPGTLLAFWELQVSSHNYGSTGAELN